MIKKRGLYISSLLALLTFLAAGNADAEKICPNCNRVFEDSIKFCSEDGTKLQELQKDNLLTVDFQSLPEGAEVLINGEKSSTNSFNLAVGLTYKLEIRSEGYKNSIFVVTATDNGHLVVEPSLTALSPEEKWNQKLNSLADNQYGDMIEIKAGQYMLGSDRGNIDEKPIRRYTTNTFWMDRTEVTCAQYKRFLEDIAKYGHKWCHPHESPNKDHTPYHTYAWALKFSWVGGEPPRGMEDFPVVLVDWFDAYAYANWAGKRLPNESEWEIAARGTDSREYPWGNTFSVDKCNVGEQPMAVDSFPDGKSPWGVCDLAGNVCEWTATAYEPKASISKNFGGKYGLPIIKGGSWDDNAMGCRSSCREARRSPYYRSTTVGFRCVSDRPPRLLQPGKLPQKH